MSVGIVGYHNVLPVLFGTDGPAVLYLQTIGVGQWRRSHGNLFQFTEIITEVGRLVVAHALPYHGIAVHVVVPEGGQAVVGGPVAHEYTQGVATGDYHLFAPVAEDVSHGTRIILRTVVHIACTEEYATHIYLIHLGSLAQAGRVEYLFAKIAIPVNATVEVEAIGTRDHLIGHEADSAAAAHGGSLRAGVFVGKVTSQCTSIVASAFGAEIYLRGCSVAVVVAGMVLKAGKLLQSPAVGIEVGAMLCVAMAQAGGGEPLSVVINDHGAEDNLVATVHIHIADGEVVVALPEVGATLSGALPAPVFGELMGEWIHAESLHLVHGITSTS